jgi:hypothetical protein
VCVRSGQAVRLPGVLSAARGGVPGSEPAAAGTELVDGHNSPVRHSGWFRVSFQALSASDPGDSAETAEHIHSVSESKFMKALSSRGPDECISLSDLNDAVGRKRFRGIPTATELHEDNREERL